MRNLQDKASAVHPQTVVRLVDESTGFPSETRNQVRVLTVPDPKDARRHITNVVCHYSLRGGDVSFHKSPSDSPEGFEDALNWATAFARQYGIATVYAGNFATTR